MCGKNCAHASAKKADKAIQKRVNGACQRACVGIQVNIMDLGKISNAGLQILKNSDPSITDEKLTEQIRAYALTLPGTVKA